MDKVLIVEDEKESVKALKASLKKLNIECAAIKKVKDLKLDDISKGLYKVIIMKFVLEDLLSIKQIIAIKNIDENIQVVFITDDSVTLDYLNTALNEGVFGFVKRPLTDAKVKIIVNRALKRFNELKGREDLMQELKVKKKTYKNEFKYLKMKNMHSLNVNKKKNLIFNKAAQEILNKGDRIKILIVGDSDYQSHVLKRKIDLPFFNVLTAHDAKSGINIALVERPKIIMSDMELTGMTGVDLCRKIKDEKTLKDTYFIICTAALENCNLVMEENLAKGHRLGVDDLIGKPSTEDETNEFLSRIFMAALST